MAASPQYLTLLNMALSLVLCYTLVSSRLARPSRLSVSGQHKDLFRRYSKPDYRGQVYRISRPGRMKP